MLDGGVEKTVSSLNSAYGDQVEVKCIPLRTYEGFARNVLGVDETLTQPSPHKLGSDGRIYMLHFVNEYRGLSLMFCSTAVQSNLVSLPLVNLPNSPLATLKLTADFLPCVLPRPRQGMVASSSV